MMNPHPLGRQAIDRLKGTSTRPPMIQNGVSEARSAAPALPGSLPMHTPPTSTPISPPPGCRPPARILKPGVCHCAVDCCSRAAMAALTFEGMWQDLPVL